MLLVVAFGVMLGSGMGVFISQTMMAIRLISLVGFLLVVARFMQLLGFLMVFSGFPEVVSGLFVMFVCHDKRWFNTCSFHNSLDC